MNLPRNDDRLSLSGVVTALRSRGYRVDKSYLVRLLARHRYAPEYRDANTSRLSWADVEHLAELVENDHR